MLTLTRTSPCPRCTKGKIVYPLNVCDLCSLDCGAEFDYNEEYCVACGERGKLGVIETEIVEGNDGREAVEKTCSRCKETDYEPLGFDSEEI